MSINFTPTRIIFFLGILILSVTDGFAQIGNWETVTNSGIIHRHECSFTLSNGKFYLIGGRRLGIEKYTDVYDPLTGTWSHGTHTPPILELHHFQAVSYNSKIYVIGAFIGGHPDETPVDRVYIYNTLDDTWSEGGMIPANRRRGAAGAVLYNNKIYIIGGASNGHIGGNVAWLDEYDPATQQWTQLPDAPNARDHFQAVVHGNKLYMAGGRRSILNWNVTTVKYDNADELVYEVDVYDFSTNAWQTYPNNIPTGRAGTAAVVLNNELLVIGGESSAHLIAHSETEAMDLTIAKTWRQLAPLDSGRHATHALVFNNEIYIVSGAKSRGGSSSSELNSMEVFSQTQVSGIQNTNILNTLTIYPNPIQNQLVLENISSNINWSLLDNTGHILREGESNFGSQCFIDMNAFTLGIYILSIKDIRSNATRSVLIKKD